MLTRELLHFRTRQGKLRPAFVSREDPELRALAASLVAEVEAGVGGPREAVEEALDVLAGAFARPRVARGLVKLLLDRMEFEPPHEEAAAERASHFARAAAVLRALPKGAGLADYEAALDAAIPGGLEAARTSLYADLPHRRTLLAWDALSPEALLDRYNLALAQGPLLTARRLTLTAKAPELLRVRKVLRWLKFCRLVAEVKRVGGDWTLEVEGPGAVLSLQKKYGLQLATFLGAVPLLERWELTAEVEPHRRGARAVLHLSDKDPLTSPHAGALGWVPPEVQALADGFRDDAWEVDLTPLPRHVGAAGLCVPDLTVHHRASGREVAVELFHAWHAGALARRLAELATRPDPDLVLGVDRALARAPEQKAVLEAHPQVLLFNGFPSAKKLSTWLARE